jgi:ABC-type uncharacterized transport system auxiliary subunit
MRRASTTIFLLSLAILAACGEKPIEEIAPAVETATVEQPPADVSEATVEIDPTTGFVMTGDWQLVRAHCTGCHSSRLITQQRGTAQQWLAMIRWMQKKQNLWQFDAGTEARIIAYLSDNYPPDAARRRAAIPLDLMPPNPYSSTNTD